MIRHMTDIDSLLRGFSVKDATDAIYYAVRYIQHADRMPQDSKDLFADGVESTPSKEARGLTKKLLRWVESTNFKSAADLTDWEASWVIRALIEAAARLDGDIPPDALDAAERWVGQLRAQTGVPSYTDEAVIVAEPISLHSDLADYSHSHKS